MSDNPTIFDLSAAALEKGTPQRFEVELKLLPLHLAGQDYVFVPQEVPAQLSIIMLDQGYSVSMAFKCKLAGACWRCLEEAELDLDVQVEDFFETELPPIEEMGEEDEPSLWYSEDGQLNLSEWAHDAVAELLPPKILCDEGCKGLCSQCGANLNVEQCGCEAPADSRWDKLKEWGTQKKEDDA